MYWTCLHAEGTIFLTSLHLKNDQTIIIDIIIGIIIDIIIDKFKDFWSQEM